jgi:hypothetical protein
MTEQTNCITELLPQRALERAAYLDAYLAEHKKPIGPLHGLPISVKEHIGMKGLDWNGGFVSWVGKVAKDDAHILSILWSAGCVFYVRSTQPQSLMHLETSSNLYGYVEEVRDAGEECCAGLIRDTGSPRILSIRHSQLVVLLVEKVLLLGFEEVAWALEQTLEGQFEVLLRTLVCLPYLGC